MCKYGTDANETFISTITSRCIMSTASSFLLLDKERRRGRRAEAADCRSGAKCYHGKRGLLGARVITEMPLLTNDLLKTETDRNGIYCQGGFTSIHVEPNLCIVCSDGYLWCLAGIKEDKPRQILTFTSGTDSLHFQTKPINYWSHYLSQRERL